MGEKKYGPNTAEVDAFLALLPELTDEQREAARKAALPTLWGASRAAVALVMRDLITPEQFDTLTAPMRAAGIDFDVLTTTTNRSRDE